MPPGMSGRDPGRDARLDDRCKCIKYPRFDYVCAALTHPICQLCAMGMSNRHRPAPHARFTIQLGCIR